MYLVRLTYKTYDKSVGCGLLTPGLGRNLNACCTLIFKEDKVIIHKHGISSQIMFRILRILSMFLFWFLVVSFLRS